MCFGLDLFMMPIFSHPKDANGITLYAHNFEKSTAWQSDSLTTGLSLH